MDRDPFTGRLGRALKGSHVWLRQPRPLTRMVPRQSPLEQEQRRRRREPASSRALTGAAPLLSPISNELAESRRVHMKGLLAAEHTGTGVALGYPH